MFLGYQNGKIKFYTENELDKTMYNLDRVEETLDEYVLEGDEYVLYDETYKQKELAKLKEEKKLEASARAYEYINNGAKYEFETGKHIEATDGNISKLGLALAELRFNKDGETTIEWCTFEDEIVHLNLSRLLSIVQGLKIEQSRVWTELYPEFLYRIESAQTLEEVKNIVIDYEKLNKERRK